jgi:hypothetical protein
MRRLAAGAQLAERRVVDTLLRDDEAAQIVGIAHPVSVGRSPAKRCGAAATNFRRCAGSLIESRNLNVGGKKVGELDVYYNGATGKNCARMNHTGSTWGKKLTTRVWIGIALPGDAGGPEE